MHERRDGLLEEGAGPDLYLAPFGDWPPAEQAAAGSARGRVLDLGCGAGRLALHLQHTGLDVVGADASPLAAAVARRRGLRQARVATWQELSAEIGSFDTVALFGNNAGIFGTPARLQAVLARWARRMGPDATVLAESTSPYAGTAPLLDAAHRRANRAAGRMPGQLRLRYRYGGHVSPWFDWLFLSPAELRRLLRGTGWGVETLLDDGPTQPFVAVLRRRPASGSG
ncbi:MAG: class I SAM-dependent methyltransferase [Acidobacteriota bacterium]|nr:class I SAM-dependent methyltransferase [Acidobacteriota bacterium]